MVVLNDDDTIENCFDKTEFSGRPGNFSGTFFQKGKTGISTTEGKYWTSQREFLMSHLAHLTGKLAQELPTDPFIIRNLLGPGVKSLEDVVMDEVEDLKTWLRKKEGEPLALSYKLNIGILNVLWSVTCGRWEISALCHYSTLLCSENFMLNSRSSRQFTNGLTKSLRYASVKIEIKL